MSKSKTKIEKQEQDDLLSRRGFASAALGGVGLCYAAAVSYPVYRYLSAPVEKSMAAAAVTSVTPPDAVKLPPGKHMMFKFGARPALLIHHKDGTWAALDAVCTHLGCTVQYETENDRIFCACHGGIYDAKTGKNISGPPPRPLGKYVVTVSQDAVVVAREKQG